ncbi:MAG: dolichol kinase [Desulfurococcus sp.]|nr:dolichol kinase [Desulfurococcus sp.]
MLPLEPQVLVKESVYTLLLLAWVIVVVHPLTKHLYYLMRRHGVPHNKAVYYNRKIIHILAGGLVSIMIPLLEYKTPVTIIPMIVLLAAATYLPHKKGKLMYWFQDPENINEVHFIIMWGVVMTSSWLLFNNWVYGVVPVAFMSFGDGVTGIVRNLIYGGRNKSWYGNIAMLATVAPIGYYLAGLPGLISAVAASIVEHFEIYERIDDNITVPLTGFTILLALNFMLG